MIPFNTVASVEMTVKTSSRIWSVCPCAAGVETQNQTVAFALAYTKRQAIARHRLAKSLQPSIPSVSNINLTQEFQASENVSADRVTQATITRKTARGD